MVAALSPADINYDETLSTLRCVLDGGGPSAPPGLGGSGPSLPESGTPARGDASWGDRLICDFWGLQWLSEVPGSSWALFHSYHPSGCTLGL